MLEVLCAALDAGGLPRARIGLGDAGLFRGLLAAMGVSAGGRAGGHRRRWSATTSSSSSSASTRCRSRRSRKRVLTALPQLRGGADVIDRAVELGGEEHRGAVLATAPTWPTGSSSAGSRTA